MDNPPNKRQYDGFPDFFAWSNSGAQLQPWEHLRESAAAFTAATAERRARALRIVRRAAAIDTGAIEGLYDVDLGFTMTVAMESVLWQMSLQSKEDARALIEAQLQAYERLVDIINGPWPLTEAVIRELHREVCKHQDTYTVYTEQGPQQQELRKGEYKQQPNNVISHDGSIFEYARPEQVGVEMSRLVEVIRSKKFQDAHPVLQASWVHYAFILIHPFADGNGRVARLLASIFLMAAAQIPLLIFADQKKEYLIALRKADVKEFAAFIEFIAQCVKNAFQLLTMSLEAAHAPEPEESLRQLRQAYFATAGVTYEELSRSAREFIARLQRVISDKFSLVDTLSSHSWSAVEIGVGAGKAGPPKMLNLLQYVLKSTPPVEASTAGFLHLSMPPNVTINSEYEMRWGTNPQGLNTLFSGPIQDMLEPNSARVSMQMEMAAETVSRYAIADLASKAAARRRELL